MEITVEDGVQLSEEAADKLREHSDMIECQCPNKLLDILDVVRDFTRYTEHCIDNYPEDRDTHKWLKSSAINIDQLISTTLIQLARIEGFINEENEIVEWAQ